MRIGLASGFLLTSLVGLSVQASENCQTPVEKPKAVVEVFSSNSRKVLEDLADSARRVGFEPSGGVQWSDGFFHAAKRESDNVEHRVVIWIEWSLQQPGNAVRVYLRYGKYKKYTGGDWSRLEVSDQEEREALLPLEQAVHRLAGF